MLARLAGVTDFLEHFWEEVVMKRFAGPVLVAIYLGSIVLIEINRQVFMPGFLSEALPESHFFAVEVAFTVLLFTEVVSLIFGLTRSFSRSIGIQMEILSLILLRDTFKKFTEFPEPLQWDAVADAIPTMGLEALGALAVFVIIQIYYRVQRDYRLIEDDEDQQAFVMYKKLIALGLVVILVGILVVDAWRFVVGEELYPFFETFYTVLIFTDVLMVLLSLRYTSTYLVVFRNFAYALVTVFVRLALIAPPPINAGIGVAATLFALGIAYSYNVYAASLPVVQMQKRTTVLSPQADEA